MKIRKLVVAAAVAGASVIGFASAVSANMLDGATDATSALPTASHGTDWYWVGDDGALFAADNNNIGPFQACHNNGAGSVFGGAASGSDIIGILGFDNDDNSATVVKTCEQGSDQDSSEGKWYRADSNGVVSASNNNIGPFQACHNNVSVAGAGGAGTISDLTAILGADNDGNASDVMKTCEQSSSQDSSQH